MQFGSTAYFQVIESQFFSPCKFKHIFAFYSTGRTHLLFALHSCFLKKQMQILALLLFFLLLFYPQLEMPIELPDKQNLLFLFAKQLFTFQLLHLPHFIVVFILSHTSSQYSSLWYFYFTVFFLLFVVFCEFI